LIRLVYLACSMAMRNPLNRRMRTRMSWWCGRGERVTAPPMPIILKSPYRVTHPVSPKNGQTRLGQHSKSGET
jgi:hypothetical protein